MKRSTARKAISCTAAALAAMLLALCCAGCGGTAERRQAQQGKALMETYLKARDDAKKVFVDTAYTDRTRPAADRIEMTEFVHGDYRLDGTKYEYWVNTATGEIFTSERREELRSVCYDLLCAELGVDPAHCVGTCVAVFPDAPRDTVLPAEITDPAAYARGHLHSDELVLSLWLVCTASEAPPERWTAADTAGWNQDEARICVMPLGEALPEFGNGVNLGYDYFKNFTGDKYKMTSAAVEYTPQS